MLTDRIKDGLERFIRAALPQVDYLAFYRARVASQSSDKKKVDVQPDDPKIPGTTAELLLGLPGVTVEIQSGAHVLLGWKGGDPRLPIAIVWESGASVSKLVLGASEVDLGGELLADGVVTKKDLQVLFMAISTAPVVAMDGGASLKAGILATLGAAGWSSGAPDGNFASSKIKAQR